MKIIVNGKSIELDKSVSITELLLLQKVQMPEYVSVQLNNQILLKEDFEKVFVSENDNVELMYFMGGGAL